MKRSRLWAILALAAVLTSPMVGAQVNQSVSINDLDWMTGRWIGQGFGGTCEEVWNPALGGTMTGSFKLVVGDKPYFYEIMVIGMKEGQPNLKLKHFDPELKGWEEKDESIQFPFKSLNGQKLEFDGIIYELVGENRLNITITGKNPDGKIETTLIEFTKE